MNQALARLLEGNNTTISIAHRLSTIQRSDRIVCLGADGRVAQTGSYRELSADKEGAFAKLMEWQMNGGPMPVSAKGSEGPEGGELTEEERMRKRLEEADGEGEYRQGEAEEVGEGTEVRGEKQTSAEAALERSGSK